MSRVSCVALAAGLLLSALSVPASAQTPPDEDTSGSVSGTVTGRFQSGTRVLGFAVVEAAAGSLTRSILTDSVGQYHLADLPTGEIRLRASHPGHSTVTIVVTVPGSGSVTVDLELQADPIQLRRLNVLGDRDVADAEVRDLERPGSLSELEVQALDLAPGVGQAGIVNAVRALPGNDPANATDVLFMRGSTTDLKLVLLDGAPVYTPFHVAGLLRSFEPTVLGSADLHVGGAPARYDGGLTHILELRTRQARRDRVRASGSIDLLAASAALETPIGDRAGVVVSARSLHGLGEAPLRGQRPYGYRDALMSLDVDPAEGHKLHATGFWNSESVLLDFLGSSDDATWSNIAGTVAYGTDLGPARLDVTTALSAYRASLPLQPAPTPGEPLPEALLASAATDRVRVVAEATWNRASSPVRTGVSFERIDAAFRARATSGTSRSEGRGVSSTVGAFVDVTRPLAEGVTVRAGLRADHFSGNGTLLAPRAALMWELSPQALLTVAAGRYHQPTRTPDVEVERTLAEVVDLGVPRAEILPVATADHVVLSLDQRLGTGVQLGLEGFWKRYDGLQASGDETIRSSGIDVRILSGGDRAAGWIGYGLSWFWSSLDLSGHTSDFAGRHLLSAGLSGRLGGRFRGEARVAYGAGLPYTSIPFRSPVSSAGAFQDEAASPGVSQPALALDTTTTDPPIVGGLDEEFLRLDLEIQALFEPRWGGRRWRVQPYLRVLNALNQRDALFATFQPWRSDAVTPLAQRPLLPILGVSISF